ncbi:MAG: HAD-IA family hydrolase [Nitrospirae bacterium]|nr:HAD-IA family hydrolase [Nitrospirota bacterium]
MIKAVFLDIDGVLTDGKVTINASGEEAKTISYDDIDAIFELKRLGIKIGFLTGEDNHFTRYVKRRFLPDFFSAGCKDKLNTFKTLIAEASLNASEVCYVGDSKKDISLLEYLEHSFAPSNAIVEARAAAKTTLRATRGEGVVKEILEHISHPRRDKRKTNGRKNRIL